ncbi:ADP-ribosylation factor-like protein 8 [Nematocida parisii]|uniref:Uncharacterized protein n=1 Tax=Nematocida parisii (strain ERTm3) TaxID=935791 RepID=I3EHI5_NEMP3|nr:uncharacterized protein NEPG_00459 [Nematocida parisii ERTm1]EIJ88682.1 hypothetical protein NEQG_01372 [Nematocida parisii ERTm3]KAI5126976.1 ADP-ribosylation factor-like protein 8 [Nematocida parisii]EIJ94934.1 hypothetical protein NEPG_00459 [Nematocida parisii ERTm1]KAI5129806.1 ADP-ribosylation factor-like protein 8 [Nematocida parisii]KAI5140839.1 ADP-ribosylation factor-like protein 8 [Nematocida parisii]|eukprot:XP_013058290.1 hypothetical protein NEPG_00459 [Nematocida parisii ERTm1]
MGIRECLIETRNCLNYYFFGKKIKICLCGPSKSGKTSFYKAFTEKKVLKKEPSTIGSRTRHFTKNGLRGLFFDIGGAAEYNNLRDLCYRKSNALLFFVNASDPDSFIDAKTMLLGLLNRNKRKNMPILILCTHNDVEGFVDCKNIALHLSLDSFLGKDIACYSISSLTLSNFTAVEEWIMMHAK